MVTQTSSSESEHPIIEVRDFMAAYGEHVVMKDVSFTVERGEVIVIIGGSGCGKSTLLKHMIGLYEPAEGTILINGKNIGTAAGRERHEILRQIGVTYQSGALFGSMTVRENVRLPLDEYTRLSPEAKDLITLMKLDLVDLREAADKLPSELSGGMRKRAGIARAMVLDPQVLFLDEPSAGLDPVTSAELDELILTLSRNFGMTVVVVSHELASIFTIADRLIFLDKRVKTVSAIGKPEELRDHGEDEYVRNFLNRETQSEA
jgi:phospholipid/cholesterol/gamma-HCH transport system ATP-binding protein